MKPKSSNILLAIPLLSGLTCLLPLKTSAQVPTTGIFSDLKIGDASASGASGLIIGKGIYGSSDPFEQWDMGQGSRFLWYPRKALFRVGKFRTSDLLDADFGNYSFASGLNTQAKGYASVAMGSYSTASGYYSIALGNNATAAGTSSMALGGGTASGANSTSMGPSASTGFMSTAMGNSSAIGSYSTSLGFSTVACSYGSIAAGLFNVVNSTASTQGWIATDPLFEIGNGRPSKTIYNDEGDIVISEPEIRSNALTVYKNGNMDVQGVVTCAPGGDIPMFTGN